MSLTERVLGRIAFVSLIGIHKSGVAFILPTSLFADGPRLTLVPDPVWTIPAGGHTHPVEPPPAVPAAAADVSLRLLMPVFHNGCAAMTRVMATYSGISAFATPAVRSAERALTFVIGILGVLLGGTTFLCRTCHTTATDSSAPQNQSVFSMLVRAVMGRGVFYAHDLKDAFPERSVAVILPPLVESHWHQHLFPYQRAPGLKSALPPRGDRRVVVISAPWCLRERRAR